MTTHRPNDEPWKACYRQLAPKLLLFARQWIASAADAEDVVQVAFVKFWQRQPAAAAEHYPLLYAAVRTTALDLLRRNARRGKREQALAAEVPDAFFENALEPREDAEALEAALRRLPEAQREVLVLRIWGELTFAEIATALDQPSNTVASRYRYAVEALRRVLKPHEYERV